VYPLVLTLSNVIGSWQPQQLDVILKWRPAIVVGLHHYTLYQAAKTKAASGAWEEVARIPPPDTSYVQTIPDHLSSTWYVTATDEAGNESQASNTVDLDANPRNPIVSNPGRLPT